jgi:HEAT repeat protein
VARSAREPAAEGEIDALAAALESPRVRARLAAATRLREHPGSEAEALLLRTLEDDSVLVRQAALGSLVALEPDRDPEPVVAAARRRASGDGSTMVRVRAADEPVGPAELVWLGLWRLGRLNSVETLLAALAERGADAEAADWLLRADVLRVLGKLGDRRAVTPLVGELRHQHPSVRDAAAEALGALGEPESVASLVQAFHDEARRVRRSAARSLARLGTPKAVAALRSATHSAGALDRLYAARLLVARRLRRARASR